MTNLALPLWSVVNLDTLVKSGFPAAFVRTNSGVALFSAQTLADAFIQDAKAGQDYPVSERSSSRLAPGCLLIFCDKTNDPPHPFRSGLMFGKLINNNYL